MNAQMHTDHTCTTVSCLPTDKFLICGRQIYIVDSFSCVRVAGRLDGASAHTHAHTDSRVVLHTVELMGDNKRLGMPRS